MTEILTAIVSVVVSSIVAYVVAQNTIKHERNISLKSLLDKIIEFSITYPFLEDDDFCSNWPNADCDKETALRYESYCCIVFNLLESTWKYFSGDKAKILAFLHVEELINRHKNWWHSDPENLKGYDPKFAAFISEIILDMEE